MRDVTFEKLRSMVQHDPETGIGEVPSGHKRYWKIYRGDQWTDDELARFAATHTHPFSMNEIAALIDTYVAKLDPSALEPILEAEDGESAPFQELGTAFLVKARKIARVERVEKQVPRHQFIQGVTATFCAVVSDNGRLRHRVDILNAEEIRYDSRAMLPNAADSLWRAFVRTYTLRELRLREPSLWATLKKGFMTSDGKLDDVVTTSSQTLFTPSGMSGMTRSQSIELCWIEWREHRKYLLIPTAQLTELDIAAAEEHSFTITVDGLRLESDEIDLFEEWMANYGAPDDLSQRSTRGEGEAFYYAIVAGAEVLEQGQLDEGCFRIHLCCGPPVKRSDGGMTYRSLVDDTYGPQRLLNHSVTTAITGVGRGIKGAHVISDQEDADTDFEMRGGIPSAIWRLKAPEQHKYLPFDSKVIEPAMALVDLAKRAMNTRMGSSEFSQGRVPEGDKLTRTSSKALDTLLTNADAPVKAYYEAFVEWRIELSLCMLRQITHWSFEDMAKMLGMELVFPLAQALAPRQTIPSQALWQIEIGLHEPQKDTDAAVAASVIGQGILPQLAQLGVPMPPEVIIKVVEPIFRSLSKQDLTAWKAYIQQMQMQQQQQAGQTPPEEATN